MREYPVSRVRSTYADDADPRSKDDAGERGRAAPNIMSSSIWRESEL